MTIDFSHVPRLLRPVTALSGTQTTRAAFAFPADGGVQAVDAAGNIVTLAGGGGSGSVITVTNALNAVSTALTVSHVVSPSVGVAAPLGVSIDFTATTRADGTLTTGGRLAAAFIDITPAAETSYLLFSTMAAGALTQHCAITDAGNFIAFDGGQTIGTAGGGWGTGYFKNSIVIGNTNATTLTKTSTDARAIAFPDAAGTVALLGAQTFTGVQTFGNASTVWSTATPVLSASFADTGLALRGTGTGITSLQGSAGAPIVGVQTHTGAPRLGFFAAAATPVVQPTGVAVDITAVHTALVNLGLITGP